MLRHYNIIGVVTINRLFGYVIYYKYNITINLITKYTNKHIYIYIYIYILINIPYENE